MLRSFRLANHRSFLDEQELLLIPSAPGRDHEIMTVAAIYGANASGKSNLLDGLWFMRDAVSDSYRQWEADKGVPRRPFLLTAEGRRQPSTFVVEIVVDGVSYTYGFRVDDDTVVDEWLYSYPEKRKRVLFEREGMAIKFGTTVGGIKARLGVLGELTRPNALFLSLAAQSNMTPFMPVYRWFTGDLRIRAGLPAHQLGLGWSLRMASYLGQDEQLRRRLVRLLTAADTGITDLYVHHREPVKDGARAIPELRFTHGDASEPFGIEDESDGTRNWLDLLPSVLDALDGGRILLVDEIDSSLHPLLTIRLLNLFASPETNPRHAQLVFTTHDTTPLGSYVGRDVLQRDQVWFVEKDPTGQSRIYPLTDFKPRSGENAEKRYLGGSYGAVPIIADLDFDEAARR